MWTPIEHGTIGSDVEVVAVGISYRTSVLLKVSAPIPGLGVCSHSMSVDVEPISLTNDRSEPFIEPKGTLKPLFVCRTPVEMDVVRTCYVSYGSKARFVERQNPIK